MGRKRKENAPVEKISLNLDEQKKVDAIDEQIQNLKEKRKREISKAMSRAMKEREAAFDIMEKAIESILDKKVDADIAIKISDYLTQNAEDVVAAVLGATTENVQPEEGENASIF